jgi:5'-nucleotidase
LRLLLTNDDGINAPGIKALWEELAEIAEIHVVAPDSERSATSQAITVHQPIRVDTYPIDHTRIAAWRISGTPTDCVKIAIEALLPDRPDIVVSGINQGPNLGTDVLYSGTVSAAIEGALHNIPSVAVSLDSWESGDFKPAAQFTRNIVQKLLQNPLPPHTLLNINVPVAQDKPEMADVAITKLGVREYDNTFDRRKDPRGRTYYWMGGKVIDSDNDSDTDVAALKAGKISVTPIHFDLTNYSIMGMLKKWNLDC